MAAIYKSDKKFPLERGGCLPELEIAYTTYGKLNADKSNVVWVCHALTANSEVDDWWPNTVVEGGFLDPEKWFVVCANIIGSHYGTTGPLSINPETSKPYYNTFPAVTVRDMVNAHILLAEHLGIDKIHALVGSSIGGFQAIEWACQQPERIEKLILIATAPKVSPWVAALNETQRMAIKADGSYGEEDADAGKSGMAVARAIGLLSYRGASGYNLSQQNPDNFKPYLHRASTYQNYQGQKLCDRFNAYSYMSLLDAFDSHDITRDRGNLEEVLSSITSKTACIGITTDILFPPEEMKKLSQAIPEAEYFEINSEFGHDGFLVEHSQLNDILNKF